MRSFRSRSGWSTSSGIRSRRFCVSYKEMFPLKPISAGSVDGALAKAERYRLLNEPGQAESICRDILSVDPENQEALTSLILALTDQIPEDPAAFANAIATAARLASPYDRAYYTRIAWQRRAN